MTGLAGGAESGYLLLYRRRGRRCRLWLDPRIERIEALLAGVVAAAPVLAGFRVAEDRSRTILDRNGHRASLLEDEETGWGVWWRLAFRLVLPTLFSMFVCRMLKVGAAHGAVLGFSWFLFLEWLAIRMETERTLEHASVPLGLALVAFHFLVFSAGFLPLLLKTPTFGGMCGPYWGRLLTIPVLGFIVIPAIPFAAQQLVYLLVRE